MTPDGRAVVLAGGWMHPPDEPVAALTEILGGRGLAVDVVTSPGRVAETVAGRCDLLVAAACWFSMTDDRYDDQQRAGWAVPPDPRLHGALDALAATGTPVLAVHTAVICFDGWPAWGDWLGGRWDWSTSSHPPPGPLSVVPEPGAPVTVDPFDVIDEEYQGLHVAPDALVVARSAAGHPLMWVRPGDRRAAVDVLGHDHRSWDDPGHRRAVDRLIDWLLA